ncbi:glycosyltransferase family 2 protein [Gordonia alkanivorans]|uniref:glycosyltransferase family 2 protein n=1 Tax=Gordonia alkanivorans TaxID=84096 RepID=UPI00244B3840|nr:glycosyltransferase [Gordonia alkanivorans]MDH3009317.1 glycosyltransferase [Gordonia alkanivorans]
MTSSQVAVCIATYKRPHELRELLASLDDASANPDRMQVIVVDNDPSGSASQVCQESSLPIDYVLETTPGIPAARNAALKRIRSDAQYIAIVDDDETVSAGWLDLLEDQLHRSKADVVAGPVVSILPDEAPRWVVRGGFHGRERCRSGEEVPLAATNNVLFRIDFLQKLDFPYFDSSFTETGGSDSDLFWRMRRVGAKIVWCDEAEVTEYVPIDRCRIGWIVKRATRVGAVHCRVYSRTDGRLKSAFGGCARAAFGVLKLAAVPLRGVETLGPAIWTLFRGLGMVLYLGNLQVREYRRKPAA